MRIPRARRARSGFTLVEMLIVVTVVGILASIAYVYYASLTQRANLAVLKADMRAVMLAEALYQRQNLVYTDLENLDFTTTEGVTLDFTWLDRTGYAVTGTHVGAPGMVCGAFLGPAPTGAAEPADSEGQIVCADGP